MYSDSEIVLDALTEMLETLMQKHLENQTALDSLSMVQSFIKSQGPYKFDSSSKIQTLEEDVSFELAEQEDILSELIVAIGLQRFKMKMHIFDGENKE